MATQNIPNINSVPVKRKPHLLPSGCPVLIPMSSTGVVFVSFGMKRVNKD